jgi:thiamine biosynthesis lipoprotein
VASPAHWTCLLVALAAADSTVERHLGAMGTGLTVVVESATRADALQASELAVRAIEATERRLSTWREDSELARLNRAPQGETVELSAETARDLTLARDWARATRGAFDPAVGALVAAWDLRGTGRVPDARELRDALVPAGIVGALALDGRRATRLAANLCIEEGGFGKGAGLDAALAALPRTVTRARLDLGGQVVVQGRGQPFVVPIADPRDRGREVALWTIEGGSIATSGNSEHALDVAGTRIGHILDPRTGLPAPDFGSVSVWSASATAADCLSTALFVMGPDAALAWAAARDDVDVLVLAVAGERVNARATPRLRERLVALVPDVDLAFEPTPRATSALGEPQPFQPPTNSEDP